MSKQSVGGQFVGPGGARLPFSKAVRAGDFVFVSGQMASDAKGELSTAAIEAQTRPVLDNIQAILAEAGCTLDDVVKCTCWIDDPRDFARFNVAYAAYFSSEPPARSTVVAKLVQDAKLEIEAIAYNPA